MERDLKHDERIDAAYHIFRAMCAQYPDRLLTLVDAHGRTLARSDCSSPRYVVAKAGGLTMRTASDRHSKFEMTCLQCSSELLFPERSEHRDERSIIHVWRCPKCDYCFEVISPADTKSIANIMKRIEDILTRNDVFGRGWSHKRDSQRSSNDPLGSFDRGPVLRSWR